MPELKGFSHIDLTVSDREQAAVWWHDVMGFSVVHRSRGHSGTPCPSSPNQVLSCQSCLTMGS